MMETARRKNIKIVVKNFTHNQEKKGPHIVSWPTRS